MSWFGKIKAALSRTREVFGGELETLALAKRPVDDELWDDLEELLLRADFGVPTTTKIVDALRQVAKQDRYETSDQVVARFRRDVQNFLTLPEMGLDLRAKPAVILVVGVNGSGKTTTIGKLATLLRSQRKRVLVVAADTFRAAAAEQLEVWAKRAGADYVRGAEGSDPSSVVFDGMSAAKARGADVVLVDTAGRLQTKTNLMEELKKMRRIIEREMGAPPAETLLVVDGTTGQNALSQAKLFNEATQLTGVVVTKLDSTAKGGVLVGIVDQLVVPVKYIGLGEGQDALAPFDPAQFTKALFEVAPAA
ncbi:MAG: signal recognition particle-docking protein FtsY [Candidatus Eremiobacteraeota bacterium]|nr:signal recognition particle-docking protein FtsY [Candidatus Eremiobacteraeota bacterium]MBV9408280.1 signal recognition particle-docking protein FtsY [Candidatus Eremiobacteraeota bacterium]